MVAITVDGVTYSTIAEAALAYNLPYSIVYGRKRSGWSIHEIFHTPIYDGSLGEVTIDGVTYSCVYAACKAYNIDCKIVYNRIARGWDVISAITTPPQEVGAHCRTPVVVKGVSYSSKTEACAAYNIPVGVAYARERGGMSFEEAVTKRYVPRRRLIYRGRTFYSLRTLAMVSGVPYTTLLQHYIPDGEVDAIVDSMFLGEAWRE